MSEPIYRYTAYIGASIDAVWDGLTNPEMTKRYFFGTNVECDWEAGSRLTYRYPDGRLAATGEILSIEAPYAMEFLFRPEWDAELRAQGPVHEAWRLSPMGEMTSLTLEMYDIATESEIYEDFSMGTPWILSSLKSLIETGRGLPPPQFD